METEARKIRGEKVDEIRKDKVWKVRGNER